MATATAIRVPRLIDAEGLGDLFRALVAAGYHVIGPAVQDGAIVLREETWRKRGTDVRVSVYRCCCAATARWSATPKPRPWSR